MKIIYFHTYDPAHCVRRVRWLLRNRYEITRLENVVLSDGRTFYSVTAKRHAWWHF